MRIAALLCWYDEDPGWLWEMIHSLPEAGITDLVAADGAYAHFPDGKAHSPDSNVEAIVRACHRNNIRLTLHQPNETWPTEMAKRTHLFRLADTLDVDWYFVIDSDCVILEADRLHDELDATDLDAAEVRMPEPGQDGSSRDILLRCIFRAIPGITVTRNHYTFVTPDGRTLWGRGVTEDALDLTDHVKVLHRTNLREETRRSAQYGYYRTRDELCIEVGECEWEDCTEQAVKELPWDWAPSPEGLTSKWGSFCRPHCLDVRKINNEVLRQHGLDPATAQVTFKAKLAA